MSPCEERRLVDVTSAERQPREVVTLAWTCEGVGCGASFMGEATREDVERGEASDTCPACGGLVSQEGDPVAELEAVLRRDERGVGEVYE